MEQRRSARNPHLMLIKVAAIGMDVAGSALCGTLDTRSPPNGRLYLTVFAHKPSGSGNPIFNGLFTHALVGTCLGLQPGANLLNLSRLQRGIAAVMLIQPIHDTSPGWRW
jgi:hypothetical protein